MSTQSIFAPAKLNLFLAITGRREDGFHDLVSVVAPLTFGDLLTAQMESGEGVYSLGCTDPELACDDSNLVLRAARAFAARTGWRRSVRFRLEKRIPTGAGLGGGSSDAIAALRCMNGLAGAPLDLGAMAALASTLGSDCPLFLHDGAVVMRGRGERIHALPPAGVARVRGRRVLVFKPLFPVPTAWAYRWMVERAEEGASVYLPAPAAEQRLQHWIEDPSLPTEALLYNNMETAAFTKFLALPTMLAELRRQFGLEARMTGSGSACFAILPEDADSREIGTVIRAGWGATAFVQDTRLA